MILSQLKRIIWIDILKGIGILLVVVGHSSIMGDHIDILSRFIWSFHMPLFFLVSGVLFNPSKHNNLGKFIAARFNSLIIPYFFFAVLTLVFLEPLRLIVDHISLIDSIKRIASQLLLGEAFLMPEWFLPCLFVTEIWFYLVQRVARTAIKAVVVSGVIAAIGLILIYQGYRTAVWGLSTSLVTVFLYALGCFSRPYLYYFDNFNGFRFYLIVIFLFIITILGALSAPEHTDLWSSKFQPTFLLTSITGTIGCALLANRIGNNRFLEYLGRNSLMIMLFAVLVPIMFKYLLLIVDTDLPFFFQKAFSVSVIRKIFLLGLLFPIIEICNTYIPFLVGKPISNRRI